MKARIIAIVTVVILILAFVVLFITKNQKEVEVWPLGNHSLMMTLFFTFGIGGVVGVLTHILFRMLRSERGRVLEGVPTPVVRAGEREHPGRP
jgi:uncharacterized integral membrane protein